MVEFLSNNPYVAIMYGVLIGPSLMSFGCVFVERGKSSLSLMGRSSCICGVPISWYNNIPIISYALLRGKAKCCGSTIPIWYWNAELIGLLLFGSLTFFLNYIGLLLSLLVYFAGIIFFRYKK